MITLDVSTKTCPLTREEAAFVAESLTAAVSPVITPALTSGMHGNISVMSKKRSLTGSGQRKRTGDFRSNPPQSDHVLTGC